MRLTTWNVNGIRNPFSYLPWSTERTFPAMLDILETDILVMQELKIQRKDLRDDMVLLDGFDAYFSLPKHKKGYSGVGIYTRNATCAPIKAEEGVLGVLPSANGVPYCELPQDEAIGGYPDEEQVEALGVDAAALDAEGRCVVVEFPAFVLFGVYSPANSNGMRDDFRYGFICALDCRIRNLARAGKRVVLVGDLNVSRDENDTAAAFEDCRKAGMTHEDYISTPNRRIFNQLLVDGEVAGERDEGREKGVLWDTCRGFHPDRKGMYTHWEQKINARPGNYGGRIDFVLVSESMRSWVKDANIQEGLLGSDHCPVFAEFHDTIRFGEEGEAKAMLDVMSPAGVFVSGVRQLEWKVGNVPAFSAKRLPEFDKRRSIKSMFTTKKSEISTGETSAPNGVKIQESMPAVKPGSNESQSTSTTDEPSQQLEEKTVPSPKRKLSLPVKEKPVKKQKSESNSQSKGQKSLTGFFTTQGKRNTNSLSSPLLTDTKPTALSNANTAEPTDIAQAPPEPDTMPTPPDAPSPTPSDISTTVAAAEASQRSWSTLFAKPAAPMCEGHNERCKTMQTKKKGSNQGRSFWMCARPLGPSGEKERGTGWRCGTFIWCSDWKPNAG